MQERTVALHLPRCYVLHPAVICIADRGKKFDNGNTYARHLCIASVQDGHQRLRGAISWKREAWGSVARTCCEGCQVDVVG